MAQEYMDTTIAEMSAHFTGPWPMILRHTDPSTLKASNARDKLPFKNAAPVIFIGDSCHAMSPFAGAILPELPRVFILRLYGGMPEFVASQSAD